MTLQLRATRHQLADLKRIVDLGANPLAEVQTKLRALQAPTLRPQDLLNAVREVLAEDDAESLVRQLLSLHGIVRQSGQTVENVISGVRAAIEQRGTDASIDTAAWKDVEDIVKALVEERNVRLTATAIELAYDYSNLLRQARILTDIRPLYDQAGDKIEGAVVSYTLQLRYDSADGEHELSIALDHDDVQKLAQQCGRAIRKAAAAKALMKDQCEVAVAVFGEVKDA